VYLGTTCKQAPAPAVTTAPVIELIIVCQLVAQVVRLEFCQ
jgi:hypothetical protein